jgi:hypothetical protein
VKKTRVAISPAVLISITIIVGFANIFFRAAICGPSMEPLDTCHTSTVGFYLFPHPIIYTLADANLDGWISIIILAAVDAFVIVTLFSIPYMRKPSLTRSLSTLVTYLFLSVAVSYICVYIYLS